jgi:putative permease
MDNKNKFLSDEVLNKTIKILGIVLLFLAVLFMASQFSEIWGKITGAFKAVLVPVTLAWLISLIIYPIIRLLERRGVGPRGLSATIVYFGTVIILVLAIVYLTPYVVDQIGQFFDTDVPKITAYFQSDFRADFIFGTDIYDWIADTINSSTIIEDGISSMIDSLTRSLSSSLMSLMVVLLILPVFLFYYLLDYELVNDSLRSIIPLRYEKDASDLGNRLNQTVGAYVRGQLILMFAIGAVATIIYKLIGLKYFFVFGLIVGITNIIPYFGAIIAMVPVVAYAIITKDTGPNPFIVVLVNLVLQTIEGNIFQPVIMGKQLQIHPLLIIVSILFFGSLFGTLGVIFASPIAATIRVLIQFYNEKKDTLRTNEINAPPPI